MSEDGTDFQLAVSVLFITYCVSLLHESPSRVTSLTPFLVIRSPLKHDHQETAARPLPRWSHFLLGYRGHLQRVRPVFWCSGSVSPLTWLVRSRLLPWCRTVGSSPRI